MIRLTRYSSGSALLGLSCLAACHTVGPYQSGSATRVVVSERDVESGGYALVELRPGSASGRSELVLSEQPSCNKEQTVYDETHYTTEHVFEWGYITTPMIIAGGAGILTGVLPGHVTSAKNVALWGSGTFFLTLGLALPGHDTSSDEFTTEQSGEYTQTGEHTYDCGGPRPYQGTADLNVHISPLEDSQQGFDFRMPWTEPSEFPPASLRDSIVYWQKACELNGYRITFGSKQMKEEATWSAKFNSLPAKVARAGKLEAALKLGDRCVEQRRSTKMAQCWEAAYGKNATACERSCIQDKGGDLCSFEKSDCASLGGSANDCAATYESCLAKRGLGPEVRKQCVDKCVTQEIGTRCEDQWNAASPVATPKP